MKLLVVVTMNNLEVKKQILDKIKEYNKIILVRHTRPDGDCVGGTLGFRDILRATFPEKDIRVLVKDNAEYLSFLGKEDEEMDESFYKDALVISLDTSITSRISNDYYKSGKELIKIDHHIETEPYGDINWVEDYRSSLCEMIVDFFLTFKYELKITKDGCKALYTGIVTDSGRFKFSSASGETLRMASFLLDQGIDTERLYAELYLKDYNTVLLEGDVLKQAKLTENGVAYIYIPKKMQEKHHLTPAEASAMISTIENIRGSIIWLAFIDNEDGSIRVRLRSRFVTVNELAARYHGGGHDKASGATVYSLKEMRQLIKDADKLIKEYKENNNDWL